METSGLMARLGLFWPTFALLLFAILFHPSIKKQLLIDDEPWKTLFISPQSFFLLASLLILFKEKISIRSLRLDLPQRKYFMIALALGLMPYVALIATDAVLARNQISAQQSLPAIHMDIWNMLLLFVLAPISEELFFRGILTRALRNSYPSSVAIAASSLLFMATHSPMTIGPLLLGLINGWLYLRSQSILPGIVVHTFANGLPILFFHFLPHIHILRSWIYFTFPF